MILYQLKDCLYIVIELRKIILFGDYYFGLIVIKFIF